MTDKIKVSALIIDELKEMREKHGDVFNTFHEKYAVTLEEICEVKEEINSMVFHFDNAWDYTRKDNNESASDMHKKMYEDVIKAIQELIQVGACCLKGVKDGTAHTV